MKDSLRSEHVHFFVTSDECKADALLTSLVKARSLIVAAIVAPVLTVEDGKYIPCSARAGYEQASLYQDTLHRWLLPNEDKEDDIATDEVDANWVPEDDIDTRSKDEVEEKSGDNNEEEQRNDHSNTSTGDKIYEVYIHLEHRPNFRRSKWAFQYLNPLISRCTPPAELKDEQTLVNLICRPYTQMRGSPKLELKGLMSYLTARWLKQIGDDGYDDTMANFVMDTIRQYYVKGSNEGDVDKALRRFEASHRLRPVATTNVVRPLQTRPPAPPFIGECEYKFLPDHAGRLWVLEHLAAASPPSRQERHKPLVLWSNGIRLGTSKWAQHFGVHCYMRSSIDKKYLTDCMNDPACRYVVLDEIPWNKLMDPRQPIGEDLLGGQISTTWKNGRDDVVVQLGLPVIVISHRNSKPPRTFLDRFNPDGGNMPLYVLLGLDSKRLMYDENKPRRNISPPPPGEAGAPGHCSCRPIAAVPIAAPNPPAPVAAHCPPMPTAAPAQPVAFAGPISLVPIAAPVRPVPVAGLDPLVGPAALIPPAPIAAPISLVPVVAASSAVSAAVHAPAPPLLPLHRNLMAEFKKLEGSDAALAPMTKPLLPLNDELLPAAQACASVSGTAAASPALSLTPMDWKAVDELPDTWIMYDVITPEVEEMLNGAAEQQGGPWIEFVQSRNGKPLTRLKKIQCLFDNDWIRWYWYPDTAPEEWLPFTAINARLAQLLTKLCGGRYTLTSLVLNKYRDEDDCIVAHQDKTGDLDPSSSIVTLSTGPLARVVVFVHVETGKEVKLTVPPRSVYSIGWETNRAWKHSVPPMEGVIGKRYGWTFRSVVSLWNRVTHARVQRPQIGEEMANWDVLLPAANPNRPELLASYKVVQTVRLAEPGRLQPIDLEQISEEAQAAYSGRTVRKASNPKHRKPVEKKPQADEKKRKPSAKDVRMKKKKKTESLSDDD